jgi:hypothetical protein
MSPNDEARKLEWSILPFAENGRRSAIVVVIVIACGVLVYLAFREVFLGVISVLILFASLHTYFTRTTYVLDGSGVTVRTGFVTTRKRWSDFKRYYADRKGVTLSPFAKPTRLEPFRSLRLLYGDNRDEVVAFISQNLDGESGGGSGT